MMKAAAGRRVDVGRIVEIAEAIAPEVSVFDAPLSVDEKCLSAEKLVQLLVHGEDAAHLMSCSTCAENVRNLQGVSLKSSRDFVPLTGQSLLHQKEERSDRKDKSIGWLTAD